MPELTFCAQCHKPFIHDVSSPNNRYCSTTCFHEPKRQSTTYTCGYCGKTFERHPSRSKYGRGKHCSPQCQYAARRDAPGKADMVTLVCLGCGQTFERYACWLKSHKGSGKYCSRKCRDKYRIGENHPQYLNGIAQEKRGPNWQALRRKARRRDKWTCQSCGMLHDESVKAFGTGLQVHHIEPYRLFESYEVANALNNLITLCPRCHRKADAEIQHKELF